MKKLICCLALILALGCFDDSSNDNPTASVRFQNLTSDFTINYGVRIGEAVHERSLAISQSTDYYSISPGAYSIQMKTVYGDWITMSAGTITFIENGVYTVSIQGTMTYIYFYWIKDE